MKLNLLEPCHLYGWEPLMLGLSPEIGLIRERVGVNSPFHVRYEVPGVAYQVRLAVPVDPE